MSEITRVFHPELGMATCITIAYRTSRATGRKAEQEKRQKEIDDDYEELMRGRVLCFCTRKTTCNQCVAKKIREEPVEERDCDDVEALPDLDFADK